MTSTSEKPVVVLIQVDDSALAARLSALLSDVPGLRLARADEIAEVAVVSSNPVGTHAELDPTLTPRELEVLGMMAEGASNKAIARRLAISVHTVKFHVASLLDKLDASGRTDAVMHAARLGVIQL